MTKDDIQLRGLGDPRLAVHATASMPVWLWSIDGTRILWANPVAAKLFGAANVAALKAKIFGPADPHRRQLAQLAGRLPITGAARMERLRGFGARLGALITCACARLEFSDGIPGILVAAAEPVGRGMPLVDRLRGLIEGVDAPIAVFTHDGLFIGANVAARALLGFQNLSDDGLDQARCDALRQGRVETPIGIGHLVLQRVGTGADVGLVAILAPGAAQSAAGPRHLELEAAVVPDVKTQTEPLPQQLIDEPTIADGVAPAEPIEAAIVAPLEPEQPPAPMIEPVATGASAEQEISSLPDETMTPPAFDEASPPQQLIDVTAIADSVAPPDQIVAEPPAEVEIVPVPEENVTPPAIDGPPPPQQLIDEPAVADSIATPELVAAEPLAEVEIPPVPQESVTLEAIDGPPPQRLIDEPAEADSVATPEPLEPAIVATSEPEQPSAPVSEPVAAQPPAEVEAPPPPEESVTPPAMDDAPPTPRTHPLRFVWQIDVEGNFSQTSADFAHLLGRHTAAELGQHWSNIADALALDPEGRVAKAIASRDTWSGVTLQWPVDGGEFLEVELAGLPVRNRDWQFAGYRGFGVCRDLAALTRIDELRRNEPDLPVRLPRALSADTCPTGAPVTAESDAPAAYIHQEPPPIPDAQATTESTEPVQTSPNVVPFRPSSEPKSAELSPVENSAFNELARRLSAGLELPPVPETAPVAIDWLIAPAMPASGDSRRDKALLDLLPVGVLIYRLDCLLYANKAFLERTGYDDLHALEEAGGLDALFVEAGDYPASSNSEAGTPITIAATRALLEQPQAPTAGRLFTITWDGESALVLIFSGAPVESAPAAEPEPATPAPAVAATEPSPVGHASAEELGAILDTTAEGIVMFDADGALNSCNRSAEALFGYDGDELVQRNLTALFAPESQRVVLDYLESIKGSGVASLLDHDRELLGQVRAGGLVPLSMTMGRTRHDGPNFFAVFRDLSQVKKTEADLAQARRVADRAAGAKADVLARISHEVRAPLNAILGFADVMIEQRFGPFGNERYIEYLKDIHTSGERVFAIVNDLLDLSRIESGKLELSFANQNLNELVEQCVAVLQPQANRERIIIRTSLAHLLPPVLADAAALRQITLNLIGNSIHLANAGGQVIVSTALSDFGDIVLRVRDTGHGLNDNEVAAAMEPFRTGRPSDQSDGSGVSLSLTKALVEANRAQFQIKSATNGTLIEVIFSPSTAKN